MTDFILSFARGKDKPVVQRVSAKPTSMGRFMIGALSVEVRFDAACTAALVVSYTSPGTPPRKIVFETKVRKGQDMSCPTVEGLGGYKLGCSWGPPLPGAAAGDVVSHITVTGAPGQPLGDINIALTGSRSMNLAYPHIDQKLAKLVALKREAVQAAFDLEGANMLLAEAEESKLKHEELQRQELEREKKREELKRERLFILECMEREKARLMEAQSHIDAGFKAGIASIKQEHAASLAAKKAAEEKARLTEEEASLAKGPLATEWPEPYGPESCSDDGEDVEDVHAEVTPPPAEKGKDEAPAQSDVLVARTQALERDEETIIGEIKQVTDAIVATAEAEYGKGLDGPDVSDGDDDTSTSDDDEQTRAANVERGKQFTRAYSKARTLHVNFNPQTAQGEVTATYAPNWRPVGGKLDPQSAFALARRIHERIERLHRVSLALCKAPHEFELGGADTPHNGKVSSTVLGTAQLLWREMCAAMRPVGLDVFELTHEYLEGHRTAWPDSGDDEPFLAICMSLAHVMSTVAQTEGEDDTMQQVIADYM